MFEQKIFGDVSPEEREKLLEAHSVRKERTTFTQSLSDEEMQTASADYVRGSIDLTRMKDEAKEISDGWKSKIKEKETMLEERLEVINQQRRQVVGVLWAIPNHLDGLMLMYNKEGELIEKRPLKPEERQGRAFIEGPDGIKANPDDQHITDIDHEMVNDEPAKTAEEEIAEMYEGPRLADAQIMDVEFDPDIQETNETAEFDYHSREFEKGQTPANPNSQNPDDWAWDDPRHTHVDPSTLPGADVTTARKKRTPIAKKKKD